MKTITWKYVKPLKEQDAVQSFLKKYNVELPAKLIECIVKNNGGRPSEVDFDTDVDTEYVFKNLLSFNEHDLDSIYNFYPELFIESPLFPFAMDACGNFICYDTKTHKYVLLNHETDKVENIIIPKTQEEEEKHEGV